MVIAMSRLRVRCVTAVAARMSMVMEAMVKMVYWERLTSGANTGWVRSSTGLRIARAVVSLLHV